MQKYYLFENKKYAISEKYFKKNEITIKKILFLQKLIIYK